MLKRIKDSLIQVTLISALPFLLQAGDYKVKDFLKKHTELYKPVDEALDTHEQHHMGAFHYANEKALTNDKGKIEYKRLKKGYTDSKGKKISAKEVREQVRKHIVDYLGENAIDGKIKEMFKEVKDPKERAKFISAFTAYNDEIMEQQQKLYGGKLKWDIYGTRILPHLIKQQNEKNIEDVIEHVGVELKTGATLKEAKDALARHSRGEGVLTDEDAREIFQDKYVGKLKKNGKD